MRDQMTVNGDLAREAASWRRLCASVDACSTFMREWFRELGRDIYDYDQSDHQPEFMVKLGRHIHYVEYCGDATLPSSVGFRNELRLHPLVLVVAADQNVVFDESAVCRFLYGSHEFAEEPDEPARLQLDDRGGAFSAKNTCIGALVLCTRLRQNECQLASACVLHNPWAIVPIEPWLLAREGLRQLVPTVMRPWPQMEWT